MKNLENQDIDNIDIKESIEKARKKFSNKDLLLFCTIFISGIIMILFSQLIVKTKKKMNNELVISFFTGLTLIQTATYFIKSKIIKYMNIKYKSEKNLKQVCKLLDENNISTSVEDLTKSEIKSSKIKSNQINDFYIKNKRDEQLYILRQYRQSIIEDKWETILYDEDETKDIIQKQLFYS